MAILYSEIRRDDRLMACDRQRREPDLAADPGFGLLETWTSYQAWPAELLMADES